ncbi:putative autotransporter adhesin-like protein [Archangium gephyra]|uniref:Autotransporter adhesin-like protein n=1 Tax=Archangium gephyra TaxID=48 RepID=A0AAC8Q6M4_9BACT|nr:head GIN domain-containing protein [Archangium gephyra]AKJ01506.1 Hypothetical protein AA314_03132 [Archangium gephyra]REG34322.1 putative autotransporter adhesin-like protein [Archangium gephyra]
MKRISRGLWVGMSWLVVAVMGCGGGHQVEGSGRLVQEDRQVPEFTSLIVDDGIETTLVVDPDQPRKVRMVGDDNLVRLVRTELAGTAGLVIVHFPPGYLGSWSSRNPLRVEVTVPELRQLSCRKGGPVDVSGHVVGIDRAFTLQLSEGGTARVRGLDTGSFFLDVRDGGDVTVEGRATRMESAMSGGGVLRARELSVSGATLLSSGGGSTELRVSGSLSVTASGGGAVRIIGRPMVLQQNLSDGSTLSFE